MTTEEAIAKSLREHPSDWRACEGDGQYHIAVEHRPSGVKVGYYNTANDYWLWTKRSNCWIRVYSYGSEVVRAIETVLDYIKNETKESIPDLLEGKKTTFTADAVTLAKAVIDGREDAVYGLIDELLEQRRTHES